MNFKIALIKERKQPADSRVALSPSQAKQLMDQFPSLEIVAESSDSRVFTDQDYLEKGVQVVQDVTDCNLLLGIKEVPKKDLIPGKSYMFFSHTIKMQPYNQGLMQEFLKKQITMIDYECLEWAKGGRVLGFGRWAGIVGAYNGLLTWGKKMKSFDLKPAYECHTYADLHQELSKVTLPPIKIALTGTGRVAGGALEILHYLNIQEVSPEDFLQYSYEKPVFSNLKNRDIYYQKSSPHNWDRLHFYENHEGYACKFEPYISQTDLLINGFYWEDDLPALFHKDDTAKDDFAIKVIADITCDVEGSIPITFRATSIDDPTFGWDPQQKTVTPPYLSDTIDVMAVTNLPTEMPAAASEDFGEALSKHIIPLFMGDDPERIIERATLTKNGALCPDFDYLKDYAEGKQIL